MIDKNSKSLRRPNALLYDDDDLSSRKSEKLKHKKNNKCETKKEKRRNHLLLYLICFLTRFGQIALGRSALAD